MLPNDERQSIGREGILRENESRKRHQRSPLPAYRDGCADTWRTSHEARNLCGRNLAGLMLRYLSIGAIGRAILGKYWQKATAEQRKAYMELFPKYIAKFYAIQLSDYSGETFAVIGSRAVSEGIVVNAEINRPGGEPMKLDFMVANTEEGLKVADIKVEGVSLVITKRSEFAEVVTEKGIDGLIQAMR
jgi:ABC-type transporter MlaC component